MRKLFFENNPSEMPRKLIYFVIFFMIIGILFVAFLLFSSVYSGHIGINTDATTSEMGVRLEE